MYKAIVVGTDGSKTAELAVGHAIELCKVSGARLHIVSAVKLPSTAMIGAEGGAAMAAPADAAWEQDAREATDEMLKGAATAAAEAEVDAKTHAILGEAADALISVASEEGADLIVVGNRGMAGLGRVLGSVPNKVSHHAPCSLLIVHTT
ncbi:MAG: universal stress protein [Candidatus Dormibacteraeota bacterium]|nr:universal stress protein [Candidatus Dormibacteraeota bacterium]